MQTSCADYKQSECGKVILPFTVLRRLDCMLEAIKPMVLSEAKASEKSGLSPAPFLKRITGRPVYNSPDAVPAHVPLGTCVPLG